MILEAVVQHEGKSHIDVPKLKEGARKVGKQAKTEEDYDRLEQQLLKDFAAPVPKEAEVAKS